LTSKSEGDRHFDEFGRPVSRAQFLRTLGYESLVLFLQHRETIAAESRMYSTGRGGRSPAVAVQDIGAAAASVLACKDNRHFDKSYRIVGPEAIGPDDMASELSELLGRQIQFVDFGLEKWRQVRPVALKEKTRVRRGRDRAAACLSWSSARSVSQGLKFRGALRRF
jgi:hypothetical protein